MRRVVTTLVLEILLTALLALVLLIAANSIVAGSLATGVDAGLRTHFLFADVVYYLWVPVLVIFAIARRRTPGVVGTLTLVAAGAVLNVLVVLLIGFAQEGRIASFVALAGEGSAAVLVGALVAVPFVHRAVKPSTAAPSDA